MEQLEIHLMYGDVMAQVDAEQSVLKGVLNAMDQAVILFTAWDSIVWINNATADVLNHSFSHYRDRSIAELFAEDNKVSPVGFSAQDDSVRLLQKKQSFQINNQEEELEWRLYVVSGEQSLYLLLGERVKSTVKSTDSSDVSSYLHSVVQQMPGSVFWLDAQHCFQGCNQAFVDFFNLPDEKFLLNKKLADVEQLEQFKDFFNDEKIINLDREDLKNESLSYSCDDGTFKTVIVNRVALHNDDHAVIGILVNFMDENQHAASSVINVPSILAANEERQVNASLPSRMLIVEDNQVSAVAIQNALEDMGCRVDWVMDGQQALEKADQFDYNLIFMDMDLPDMGGVEVSRRIRLFKNAHHASVPIVAVTALANAAQQRQCFSSGIQALVNKPLQSHELKTLCKQYV